MRLSDQGQAANVPIEGEERVDGGDDGAARGLQRESYNSRSAQDHFWLGLWSDAYYAAMSGVAGGHVKIPVAIEC